MVRREGKSKNSRIRTPKPIKEQAKLKIGLVLKRIFDTVEDSFTTYYKRVFPCLRELYKIIFLEGIL